MAIINRFKIKNKLYAAMTGAVLAIVAITVYSVVTTNAVGNIVDTINAHPFVVSNAATDSQNLVLNISSTYKAAFIEKDISKRKYFEKEIEGYQGKLDKNLETIQELILGDEGQKLAKETRMIIEKARINNYGLMDKIYDMDNREVAEAYLSTTENEAAEKIQTQLNDIQNYAEKKSEYLTMQAEEIQRKAKVAMIAIGSMIVMLFLAFTFLIIKSISGSLKNLKNTMQESIEKEKFLKADIAGNDEIVDVANHYNNLIEKLEIQFNNRNGLNQLSNAISGNLEMKDFSNKTISFLCEYTNSGNGVFYSFVEESETLDLIASYAFTERQKLMNHIALGESLVGQVAVEKKPILLKNVKKGEGEINSGIISEAPLNIVGIPLIHENHLCGVIELSSFEVFDVRKMEYLNAAAEIIAVSIYSAIQNDKIHKLLDETQNANHLLEVKQQEVVKKAEELASNNKKLNELFETSKRQAEELQVQQEELRQNNEELEEQTRALKESESKLQHQQEELRVTNEELETHSKELEEQKHVLNEKNNTLAITQTEMVKKAEALEQANKYKSEFLANMSHELRTPLNSILVLSQLLASKELGKPLTKKENEFASTIHSSGKDLLTLINGVLDLSKVESGKLQAHNEKVYLKEVVAENRSLFEHMADMKKLELKFSIEEDMPQYIETDYLRLNQIIKNLISNSIKFTHEGQVSVNFRKLKENEASALEILGSDYIGIEVKDSGIGIPKNKMNEIFEAFKQSDGTTSRQYGGTGLGLTISLKLATLLGGNILHDSEVNKGSEFLLIIPKIPVEEKKQLGILSAIDMMDNYDASVKNEDKNVEKATEVEEIKLPRENEKRVLIIEDDPTFAQILSDLAEEKGYIVTKSFTGKDGIRKAKSEHPTGIILDIGLPDMDGMILAQMLSEDEDTKNIPIHVISGSEEISEGAGIESMPKSIIGFLKKPVDIKSIYKTLSKIESVDAKGPKQILVVGNCGNEDFSKFTQLGQVKIKKVLTAKDAFAELEIQIYGCIILDIKLADTSGVDFMMKLRKELDVQTPIIIYTDEEIDSSEIDDINKYAETIILKSQKSKDRLVDEASLFLHDIHRNFSNKMPVKNIIEDDKNSLLGVRVLLADDDNRNVFALIHLLESRGMKVLVAKDGHEAVKKFEENEIDLILTDIM
ncbi:MAG: response regulator, partial [Proteocatella sp.]